MAGMTGKKSPGVHLNAKGGVPKKGGGGVKGGGQQQGQPPAPTAITYQWTAVAGQNQQTLLVFSQGVIWSGGIPVNWRLSTATTLGIATAVTQLNPTNWILTWNVLVNAATGVLSIPQNDPTFKGTQGQFVASGKQFSGPQKT
jgi:hypothetical protein